MFVRTLQHANPNIYKFYSGRVERVGPEYRMWWGLAVAAMECLQWVMIVILCCLAKREHQDCLEVVQTRRAELAEKKKEEDDCWHRRKYEDDCWLAETKKNGFIKWRLELRIHELRSRIREAQAGTPFNYANVPGREQEYRAYFVELSRYGVFEY